MLSRHTLEIAAIAVPYFGLMAALCAYMAGQVRHRDPGPDQADEDLADLDVRDDGPGPVLMAA